MFTLPELNAMYKSPETEVKQEVNGALQGTSNIGFNDKSYAQTGKVNPTPINTGGKPEQAVQQKNVQGFSLQSKQVTNNQYNKQSNNQQVVSDVNYDYPSKPLDETIVRQSIDNKDGVKLSIDPNTGAPKINYIEYNREYTPIQKEIISSIPDNKEAGRADFNPNLIIDTNEYEAVLSIIDRYKNDLPQSDLQALVNDIQSINSYESQTDKIDAFNKLKVKIAAFIKNTNLAGKAYHKGDQSANMLYKYMDDAAKLNHLILNDGKSIRDEVQKSVEEQFKIKTLDPKYAGTSFKAKQELRSNPIWYQQLEKIKQKNVGLYYGILQEKNGKVMGTLEKKVLKEIYNDVVKPMKDVYYQVKNSMGEQVADNMFKGYKQLADLTRLSTKSYFDDVVDSIYQPVDIDPSYLQSQIWAGMYNLKPVSSTVNTYSKTTYSKPTYNNYSKSSYKPRVTYQKRNTEYDNSFGGVNQ